MKLPDVLIINGEEFIKPGLVRTDAHVTITKEWFDVEMDRENIRYYICPNCDSMDSNDKLVEIGDKYCCNCGKKLNWELT